MGDGAAIIGVLIVLAVILAVATLVGAIILRAAVSLYNTMAGGANSTAAVPEPPMGKAMGITFVTTLVNGVAGFIVGLVIGGAAAATGARGSGVEVTAQLVSLPISVLVMAGMLAAMLPTTFGRAILVTLCHFLISIVIAGGILVVCIVAFQLI